MLNSQSFRGRSRARIKSLERSTFSATGRRAERAKNARRAKFLSSRGETRRREGAISPTTSGFNRAADVYVDVGDQRLNRTDGERIKVRGCDDSRWWWWLAITVVVDYDTWTGAFNRWHARQSSSRSRVLTTCDVDATVREGFYSRSVPADPTRSVSTRLGATFLPPACPETLGPIN